MNLIPDRLHHGVTPGMRRQRPWLVFGAAAVVALLLYLPTLKYGFVWDDRMLVLDNPLLARTNPVELFSRGFWNNPEAERGMDHTSYYRPLASVSLYVDRKVWGLRPAGYHLTNIVINSAVVFLTCLLLWELFGSVWLAGLGGLAVGIHPAMNCIATFISNRAYLLALFFLLVSAYALGRGQRGRTRFWPALFGGSLLLGSLAIEATLTLASAVTACLLLRLGVARVPFTTSVMHSAVNQPLRIINAYGQQLQLLLFPFNQKVIYVPGRLFTAFSVYTILGLVFLGMPLCALIRLGRRNAGTGRNNAMLSYYGYGWMVLLLLPFTHLVFLGPAGRMLYLVAPGVFILAAALYRATSRKPLATRIAFGALLLYSALFAVQTLRRNPIWRDELSLTRTMVGEAPAWASGHTGYGLVLSNAGRKEEAIEQFRTAIELDPGFVEPRIGLAYALLDRQDLPGAIRELREVVRLRPGLPKTRNDLAVTLMRNAQVDSAIVE
jgi:tetratricopeptide (TPR) repeat protein